MVVFQPIIFSSFEIDVADLVCGHSLCISATDTFYRHDTKSAPTSLTYNSKNKSMFICDCTQDFAKMVGIYCDYCPGTSVGTSHFVFKILNLSISNFGLCNNRSNRKLITDSDFQR